MDNISYLNSDIFNLVPKINKGFVNIASCYYKLIVYVIYVNVIYVVHN